MSYTYRTTIIAPFEEVIIDEETGEIKTNSDGTYKTTTNLRYLPLDFQNSRSIRSSSEIISHPMKSGDVMSDHMYRNPNTISISGSFGLNGRYYKDTSYDFITKDSLDRLTKIETVFERIKNEGILCTLVTLAVSDDNNAIDTSNTRYLVRENMALNNISWTENLNKLDFTFDFKEIILVNVKTYDYKNVDDDLPEFYQPPASSVGSVLMDNGQLTTIIVESLYRQGYLNAELLKILSDAISAVGTFAVVGTAIAAVYGIVVGTVALSKAGLLLAVKALSVGIFPAGTIVAAIAAAGFGIYKIVQWKKKKEREAKISKWRKKIKNNPDEFVELVDNIEIELNKTFNDLNVYNFTSSENQTICIAIGGNWYYLVFTYNESDPNYWSAKIYEGSTDDQDLLLVKKPTCVKNNWPVVTDIFQMDPKENCWFKSIDKTYQVYLCNPSLSDEVNDTEEKKNNVKKDLTSYTIWVSKGDPSERMENIGNIIDNAVINNL